MSKENGLHSEEAEDEVEELLVVSDLASPIASSSALVLLCNVLHPYLLELVYEAFLC